MREIKFRTWSQTEKHMYMPSWTMIGILMERKDEMEPSGVVLMQFTGLLDENGKEIYEGDILEEGVVLWREDYGKFQVSTDGTEDGIAWDLWEIYDRKVFGNIYENPELLREKNDKS